MAHKLLEEYPALSDLLFADVNTMIQRSLIPLLPESPETASDKYRWQVWNTIKEKYTEASDDNFRFANDQGPCEEGLATQMWYRLPLQDRSGHDIWIQAGLNRVPGKSRWFANKILVSSPAESAQEEAVGPEQTGQNEDTRPLLERYPDFFDLVFFHNDKIHEHLNSLTGDSTLTVAAVRERFQNQYRMNGEKAISFVKEGEACSEQEADTFYFETGFFDTEGKPIRLECKRNNNIGREPWFGRFFNTSDWKTTAQMRELLDKVYIRTVHVMKALDTLAPQVTAESDTTKRAIIAKRYLSLKPEEIGYFKGTYRVDCEENADRMTFPTGFETPDGEEIMMRCRLNSPDKKQHWVSECLYLRSKNAFYGAKPGNWLFNWARFKMANSSKPFNIDAELHMLHSKVLKGERWSRTPGGSDLSLLKNYLVYTFVRLWHEDKILYDQDREKARYASFNTGLVDPAYDYIYALFIRKPQGNDCREWQFLGFTVADERGHGEILTDLFPNLPKPARYFEKGQPIYYNFRDDKLPEEQRPHYKADHVLKERVSRLPINYLIKFKMVEPRMGELLESIEKLPAEDNEPRQKLWKEVCELVSSNGELFRAMKEDVDRALKDAVKRAAWNYRTVIPYYDPNGNKICLLLPMCMCNKGKPDAAMVVEPRNNGVYQGHTIITLAMAYSNARLVCRPESDWLNINAVDESGATASDEDDTEI